MVHDGTFKRPLVPQKRTQSPVSSSPYAELVDGLQSLPGLTRSSLPGFFKALEKAMIENTEQRSRYADEPARFFDSEATLYELIGQLDAAAADNELLELIMEDQYLASLLPLLSHPNDDIVAAILSVFIETTDTENVGMEEAQSIWKFACRLTDAGVFGLVLDKTLAVEDALVEANEEGETLLHLLLDMVENLLFWADSKARSSQAVVEGWSIWLFNHASEQAAANKTSPLLRARCCEVLTELVSRLEDVRAFLVVSGVMPTVVGLLSEREGAPLDVVDLACALLLDQEARAQFGTYGGLEQCVEMIKKMQRGRMYATKVLAFCVTDEKSALSFVTSGGLGILFPLFMGADAAAYRQRYRQFDPQQDLEYILTILGGLASSLPRESEAFNRLVSKFQENGREKAKRLVTLLSEFWARVHEAKTQTKTAQSESESASEVEKTKIMESCLFQAALVARSLHAVLPTLFDNLLAGRPELVALIESSDSDQNKKSTD